MDRLPTFLSQQLGERVTQSGGVFGTARSAIKPGRFYIVGLNPGGDPKTHSSSILDSVTAPDMPLGWSVHTHDCWLCDERPSCQHLEESGLVKKEHLKPHQKRVQKIYEMLDATPGEIVVTNAIFSRSVSERSLFDSTGWTAWQWWEKCWPIHQELLAEVRPEWIITLGKGYGTSAFAFLAHTAGVRKRDIKPLGDDRYDDGRIFEADLALRDGSTLPVRVLGLPHPSYYEASEHVQATMRAKLQT